MEAEGANSPADVFLTVDTVRLARAADLGLLQSIESDVLERRIPAYLQDDDNQWFAFSQRARILFYDKTDVENPPQSYQDLANPEYEGLVCIRSATNVYTQNIVAALIAHLGEEAVQDWATAVVGKLRPRPAGWRHRPAARHRLGRVRHRHVQHLLLRPRAAEGRQPDVRGGIWRTSGGSSPTRTTSART